MLHELRRLNFWQHHGLVAVAAWLLLSAARSLGADLTTASFWHLTALSAVQVAVAYPLFTLGVFGAVQSAPGTWPFIARVGLGLAVAAPVAALFTPFLTWTFGVMPPHLDAGATRADLFSVIQSNYPRMLFGELLLGGGLWLLFNFAWWSDRFGEGGAIDAMIKRPANAVEAAAVVEPEGPPRFVGKLPVKKRGDVWAVTAEQHYLRVYTSRGDDLILMRFSDALDELAAYDGLQIHRSHWVARAAVEAVEREDKRLFVLVRNGVRLPVSRPNFSAVRMMFEDVAQSATVAMPT